MIDRDRFKDWCKCVSFVRRRKRWCQVRAVGGWSVGSRCGREVSTYGGSRISLQLLCKKATPACSNVSVFIVQKLLRAESLNTAHSTCLSSLAIYLLLLTLALSFLELYSV